MAARRIWSTPRMEKPPCFHETFGYYAQGVVERTAVLPEGWGRVASGSRPRHFRGTPLVYGSRPGSLVKSPGTDSQRTPHNRGDQK